MKTGEIPCESRMGNFQDKMCESGSVLIASNMTNGSFYVLAHYCCPFLFLTQITYNLRNTRLKLKMGKNACMWMSRVVHDTSDQIDPQKTGVRTPNVF